MPPAALAPRSYEADVIEIVSELTTDWETGLSGPPGAETRIVADLGFESIDVVYLVTAIEDRYGRQDLPFEQMLMVEGRFVDDLTVAQIAAFLRRNIG